MHRCGGYRRCGAAGRQVDEAVAGVEGAAVAPHLVPARGRLGRVRGFAEDPIADGQHRVATEYDRRGPRGVLGGAARDRGKGRYRLCLHPGEESAEGRGIVRHRDGLIDPADDHVSVNAGGAQEREPGGARGGQDQAGGTRSSRHGESP